MELINVQRRLSDDIMTAERHIGSMTNDLAQARGKASQLDAMEREYSQAQWRITSLEAELKNKSMQAPIPSQVHHGTHQSYSSAAPLTASYENSLPLASNAGRYSSSNHNANSYSSYPDRPLQNSSRSKPQSSEIGSLLTQDYAADNSDRHLPVRSNFSYNSDSYSNGPSYTISTAAQSAQQYSSGGASSGGNSRKSLASLVGNQPNRYADQGNYNSGATSLSSMIRNKNEGNAAKSSPFATEQSAVDMERRFNDVDRDLTKAMTEKSSLQEEFERWSNRIVL